MSFRREHFLSFKNSGPLSNQMNLDNMSIIELKSLFLEILNNGVHGFCFSLYGEGQKPGDPISETQIRKKLEILKPYAKWIRSFSTTEGNELIPIIAKEYGFKTLVGAWLGSETEKNQKEIDNLIELSNRSFVDIAAVGNEVLYRKDLSLEELIGHLRTTKSNVRHIPVGYVDAYYEFSQHNELSEICDLILCNCYPFWEGTSLENSLSHMHHMYQLASQAGKCKRVIITETGWPSQGNPLGQAIPNLHNALKYFIYSQLWAIDEGVELFYFSSFDESWKVDIEGEVGAYWGIWDSSGVLKFI